MKKEKYFKYLGLGKQLIKECFTKGKEYRLEGETSTGDLIFIDDDGESHKVRPYCFKEMRELSIDTVEMGDRVVVKDEHEDEFSEEEYIFVGKKPEGTSLPMVSYEEETGDLIESDQVQLAPSPQEKAREKILQIMREHGIDEIKLED